MFLWVVEGFSIVNGNVIGLGDFVLNLLGFEYDFWFEFIVIKKIIVNIDDGLYWIVCILLVI